MLAVLPLAALVLLSLLSHRRGKDWREAVLLASVLWGVLLTAMTEGLSAFRAISPISLTCLWGTTALALGFLYFRRVSPRTLKVGGFPRWEKVPPFAGVLVLGVVLLVAFIGVIAIVAPPNTWDSMTYHMSRVAHWAQNQSVAHYPTYNLPQLFHPPLAEFMILHFQVLSGGDYFANLVQWLCMAGSIVGTSLIARQLGANWQGQVLAAVLTVSIPMGILQASSTQNDYAVCFWIVCLAHFTLQAVQDKLTLGNALKVGATLGLAILTKSSGYILAFPFLVWLFLATLRPLGLRFWKPWLVVTVLFFALNLNHYLRNLNLFGSPLGTPPNFTREYKIEVYSLPVFISNVVRNLSLHSDIVRYFNLQGFITPLTGKVQRAIDLLHTFLGLDPNDPRTTFPNNSYQVPGISFDENVAGNPLHLLLILAAIVLALAIQRLRTQRLLMGYGAAIVGSFVLLCLLLKIQPYHSRHHLAMFVLFAAFVGTVFSQAIPQKVVNLLAVVILVSCLPWALNNSIRPVVGEKTIFNTSRIEQYFMARPQLFLPYQDAVRQVQEKSCRNVGLSLGPGNRVGNEYWEYPFWVLFQDAQKPAVNLEHLNPQNISDRKSTVPLHQTFSPCAVIGIRVKDDPRLGTQEVFRGSVFDRVWEGEPVGVYLPVASGQSPQ